MQNRRTGSPLLFGAQLLHKNSQIVKLIFTYSLNIYKSYIWVVSSHAIKLTKDNLILKL